MKLYRGIKEKYNPDYVRGLNGHDYSKGQYMPDYEFWTPDRSYAEHFANTPIIGKETVDEPVVLEKDIDGLKLYNSNMSGEEFDEFCKKEAEKRGISIDDAYALFSDLETNDDFVKYLRDNGYHGYKKIEDLLVPDEDEDEVVEAAELDDLNDLAYGGAHNKDIEDAEDGKSWWNAPNGKKYPVIWEYVLLKDKDVIDRARQAANVKKGIINK